MGVISRAISTSTAEVEESARAGSLETSDNSRAATPTLTSSEPFALDYDVTGIEADLETLDNVLGIIYVLTQLLRP